MNKKIAVYLRGHIRTWDFIKEINFKFFDSLPWEIDFYLATWSYPDDKLDSLKKDFENKNLKVFKTFERNRDYDPWSGPCLMTTELSKFRIHEQFYRDVEYEFIIESRFDVVLKHTANPIIPGDNMFGSTEVEGNFIAKSPNKTVPCLADHCFLARPGSHQIMNTRLLMNPGPMGNHVGMLKFANMHGLMAFKIDWFDGLISRPNIFNLIDPMTNFFGNYDRLRENWNSMPADHKLTLINKCNIDPYDYDEGYHIGDLLRTKSGL
jgi:hypothetical protein